MTEVQNNISNKNSKSWFWVSTYPFFSSTLFISPEVKQEDVSKHIHLISVYDVDGNKINSVQVQCKDRRVAILELDMLVGASKLISGMNHAQIEVESPSGYKHAVRLHNDMEARMYQEPLQLEGRMRRFFPIKISSQHLNVLSLTNTESSDLEIKLELCSGDEKVDRNIVVKSRESKLVTLELEFASALSHTDDIKLQAYLVIDLLKGDKLYAQLLERLKLSAVSESYQMVP